MGKETIGVTAVIVRMDAKNNVLPLIDVVPEIFHLRLVDERD